MQVPDLLIFTEQAEACRFVAENMLKVPCMQGTGLHGIPMNSMNSQQLMQMQLHGMDLQRMNMGMGMPGTHITTRLA